MDVDFLCFFAFLYLQATKMVVSKKSTARANRIHWPAVAPVAYTLIPRKSTLSSALPSSDPGSEHTGNKMSVCVCVHIYMNYIYIWIHSYCVRYELFMHDFAILLSNRSHTIFSRGASQYSCPTVHHFFITVLHSYLIMCGGGKKHIFPFPTVLLIPLLLSC